MTAFAKVWSRLSLIVSGALFAGLAVAQGFPEKPIRLIIGLAPGSSLDATARAISKVAPKYLGSPLVVVNMPGGTQTVAFNELVTSPADGYSIGVMPTSYKSMTVHMQKTPFDPRLLKVLLGYGQFESVILVRADSPFKKFEDLLAHGRANPGSIKFGHSGRGTGIHIMGIILFRNAGVKGAADVPFKGGTGEIISAVLGDHITVGMNSISGVTQHIKAGKLRALVTITDERLKALPDVPTLKELGQPNLSMLNTYLSLGIHRDTPQDRVKRLHDALQKTILDPELDKIFQASGLSSEYFPPDTMEKVIADAEKVSIPLLKELKLFSQ